MRYRVFWLLFLLTSSLGSQTSIRGTAPDTYRDQVVHLDILDDHLDVVTIADYQLLSQTDIDSAGHFNFGELVLPRGPGMYRLRYRMRYDPPVSMNFLQRHYLTIVISEGDSVQVDGLTLLHPSPTNLALMAAERGADQYYSFSIASGSDRQVAEVDHLKYDYLRGILYDRTANPYARIYALGKLGEEEEPTATDVLAGDEALYQTELPASYRKHLDHELGAFAYQRLRRQNTWLTVAVGVSVGGCLLLSYLLFRRSEEGEVSTESRIDLTTELTDKEREVFNLAAGGHSNKEIATALFVSVSTIKTHLNSIYRKLGVASRRELVDRGVGVNSTGG